MHIFSFEETLHHEVILHLIKLLAHTDTEANVRAAVHTHMGLILVVHTCTLSRVSSFTLNGMNRVVGVYAHFINMIVIT